jgi:hypothetical protein
MFVTSNHLPHGYFHGGTVRLPWSLALGATVDGCLEWLSSTAAIPRAAGKPLLQPDGALREGGWGPASLVSSSCVRPNSLLLALLISACVGSARSISFRRGTWRPIPSLVPVWGGNVARFLALGMLVVDESAGSPNDASQSLSLPFSPPLCRSPSAEEHQNTFTAHNATAFQQECLSSR